MHILPVSFALLTYTGYWRPAHWPVSSVKYWMYNVYSSFMFTLLQLFVFYGLVDTFLSTSLQEFVDKCFLFLSIFGVSIKLIHLFIRRRRIIGLDEMLLKENCLPRDADEASIRQKFERNARQVTIVCEILNESCAFILTFGQFYPLLKTRTLPVYGWTPFDLSSVAVFLPLLIFQSVGLLLCANSSVAHETLISGLMIEICAQFEILCHRAHMLPTLLMEAEKNSQSKQDLKARERLIIRDLIEHHLFVYKFARSVNAIFTFIMFVQFSIISFILCMSVYKMSNMTSLFTVDFAHIFSYLASMLMQIYLYCWYGNEITLKSVEVCNAVYEMDWTMLKIRVIKDLTIIMMRAAKPFTMSSGYIVTLTTESFMSILKVSYSAYNFLKDS
ncbi:odorant receptor 13a-like isoform X1 [Odontomachus brunneus]|uniref:odorant receptor 13a-like isoform X1 n=1 Tax=Odontomachus brunneus TaxID=486640 RepID=UPI0013F292FD|nr:odorant receptor 13a-like isoform X1 [Odontomachus brunneus]